MAGVASADSQIFTDLSKSVTLGDITYDATTGKFTGSGITSADADGKSYGIITFAIDWDKAKTVTSSSPLIELLFNNTDYTKNSGICLNPVTDSTPVIYGWWNDGMTSGGTKNTNAITSSIQTIHGTEYVMLTLHYERIVEKGASDGGITVYNESGTKLLEHWGLGSTAANYNTVYGIEVHTDYVSAVMITPGESGWNEDTVSKNAVATLTAAMKAVPEPTTATLSLLALCGLAARRRRK